MDGEGSSAHTRLWISPNHVELADAERNVRAVRVLACCPCRARLKADGDGEAFCTCFHEMLLEGWLWPERSPAVSRRC